MNYTNQYYSPQKMPNQQSQTITVHSTAPGQNRRGPWSPEEDRKLMELISIFGPSNWVRISNTLNTRTPKQCRERYHQNLKPSLNRTPITNEEGELIEKLVAKYGKKWAEIARHLNGRSDNAIKNWWNGGANRRRRASTQVGLKQDDLDAHANGNISSSSTGANGVADGSKHKTSISLDNKPLPSVPTSASSSIVSNSASIPTLPTPASISQPQSSQSSQHSITSQSSQSSAHPPPLPQKQHNIMSSANSSSTAIPSQFPQVPHLPQISFNTSMFGNAPGDLSKKDASNTPPTFPNGSSAPIRPNNFRSASFDTNAHSLPHLSNILPSILPHHQQQQQQSHNNLHSNQQHQHHQLPHPQIPMVSNMLPSKRRLLDESQLTTARRHSTANTIYSIPHNSSYYTNSNPNLSQPITNASSVSTTNSNGNDSPYYGSPLLLEQQQASRHNSISHFEFSTLAASSNNSSSNSRRSSIAPDFFPNPINNSSNNSNYTSNNNNGLHSISSNGSSTNVSINSPQSHKRNVSQNSFNAPSISSNGRFSISGPSGFSNSNSTKLAQLSLGNVSKPLPPIHNAENPRTVNAATSTAPTSSNSSIKLPSIMSNFSEGNATTETEETTPVSAETKKTEAEKPDNKSKIAVSNLID